jgi:hypothetical protein
MYLIQGHMDNNRLKAITFVLELYLTQVHIHVLFLAKDLDQGNLHKLLK